MTRVTADLSLKDALTRNGGPRAEICDEFGRVIGYALTPAELRRLDPGRAAESDLDTAVESLLNSEDASVAPKEPKTYTTEELLRKLGLE